MITVFRCTYPEIDERNGQRTGCRSEISVEAPGPTLASWEAERAGWRLLSSYLLGHRICPAACPEHAKEPVLFSDLPDSLGSFDPSSLVEVETQHVVLGVFPANEADEWEWLLAEDEVPTITPYATAVV